jgi:tRNA pseudouridine55 synthase
MDGFIVIDKPEGASSHDMVRLLRRLLGTRRIGHTGTLDPFATGVLPIAIGEATKAIPFLDESVKEYRATMRLGIATDTQDLTGTVVKEGDWGVVTQELLDEVLGTFVGKLSQVPPMYSALKRNGVPLYRLARKGEVVELTPRDITVHALTLEHLALPDVEFTVRCSRGTYVRTIAKDIGERLGCGAHLVQLRRIASGPFNLAHAVAPDMLDAESAWNHLVTPLDALAHMEELVLTESGMRRVSHGIAPHGEDMEAMAVRVIGPGVRLRLSWQGRIVAVAETLGGDGDENLKNLRLLRVFNSV